MSDQPECRLYAAWQNREGLIRPVGVLSRVALDGHEHYRFAYLKAAETFEGFEGLPGLPDLYRAYESDVLFPVFRNRLMPRRRPDYEDFVRRLDLDVETDPFEVLIRSEGIKSTDRVEVFAHPRRTNDGDLTMLFFLRGIRHVEGASEAIAELSVDDELMLKDEPTNPVNPRAIVICARTGRRLGWIPDCLTEMIHELRGHRSHVSATVEHINPVSAPAHMRLLCRLRAAWPSGYQPFTGPDYQPMAE